MQLMRLLRTWCVLAPLALPVAGCASLAENSSYFYGDRYHVAKLNTYPTRVIAVDGRSTMLNQNPVPVEPGERVVTLVTRPTTGFRLPEEREIRLMVEPCKYYYFVAERDNRLVQDWRPMIDHVGERGGAGCN